MNFGIYDLDTGRIRCVVGGLDIDLQIGPGQAKVPMPDGDDSTHRVNLDTGRCVQMDLTPGIFSARTVPADGQSLITITGLPDDTFVAVIGEAGERRAVVSGDLELPFNTPGVYTVTLNAGFPYASREVTIHAT